MPYRVCGEHAVARAHQRRQMLTLTEVSYFVCSGMHIHRMLMTSNVQIYTFAGAGSELRVGSATAVSAIVPGNQVRHKTCVPPVFNDQGREENGYDGKS